MKPLIFATVVCSVSTLILSRRLRNLRRSHYALCMATNELIRIVENHQKCHEETYKTLEQWGVDSTFVNMIINSDWDDI